MTPETKHIICFYGIVAAFWGLIALAYVLTMGLAQGNTK